MDPEVKQLILKKWPEFADVNIIDRGEQVIRERSGAIWSALVDDVRVRLCDGKRRQQRVYTDKVLAALSGNVAEHRLGEISRALSALTWIPQGSRRGA